MPIPETHLRKSDSLNRWFAISSVFMSVSLVWMIWVDYARPWRDYQDEFYLTKAAIAHLDYLDSKTEAREAKIDEAREQLAAAKELFEHTRAERAAELEAEIEDAALQHDKVEAPFSRLSQTIEVTRDTYERALRAHGEDHPETQAAELEYDAQKEHLAELQARKEHYSDLESDLRRELRDLKAPVTEAEKRLDQLLGERERAAKEDRDYRGVLTDTGLFAGIPLIKSLINFPLLDFTAPKNTPARHQVNQLVVYDVKQRLNYLEGYTTDRCTTCHVAIDDPEFSRETLARKLEETLDGVRQEMVRTGLTPVEYPTPPVPAKKPGATLKPGEVTDHWAELSLDQQKAYFTALRDSVNQYLRMAGRKTIDLEEPLFAHPDLELYVSIDSPHPMAKMGCTVCHEGNPQETDFVLAAHTAPTHEIEKRWKEEYYDTHLGVPAITFETISHYWDRPMRLPKYTEAGCAKCHSQVTDIAEFEGDRFGERINKGQHLFKNVGCVNCHVEASMPDARKVGPDLTRVAAKLQPEFTERWVWFPQKFRPSTRMPHFFMQENNVAESATEFDPKPELRTQTEVASITHYLYAVSQPFEPIAAPEGIEGDVERGRKLFTSAGCLACHANITEFGEQWITEDLVARENLDEETARYRYRGMTYEERVQYAMKHFPDEIDSFLNPEEVRFDPDAEYNTPAFTRFGPELSGIGSKVTFDWLYSWLIEPTHYNPETRMPSLRLTPAEAADIATYLLTLRNDRFDQERFELTAERKQMADDLMFSLLASQRSENRSRAIMDDVGGELTDMLVATLDDDLGKQPAYDLVSAMTLDDKRLTYLGSKMISHYGCYACHSISGFKQSTPPGTELTTWAEKPISQLDFAFYDHAFHHMREEQEETFAYIYPSNLEHLNNFSPLPEDAPEQITHTHGAFAKHKMLNPRIWDRQKLKKPYDKLKMPNFYFTEEEADALTTYLLSRVPPRVKDEIAIDYEADLDGPIAKGRQLTRELNCISCHQVEQNSPVVQQYYRREISGEERFDDVNAPPRLWGEGAKLQHNWFHRFLHQVEPLRPWLQIRMPSFHLSDEESKTLVAYFAALSQDHSHKLADARVPVNEYIDRQKNAGGAGEDAGADWYRQDSLRDVTDYLEAFAIDRELMRARDLDALENGRDRLDRAHGDLLKRIDFIQQLYNVEYPFVEPARPLSEEERFDRGMRFLNDMGCLKCHVLGDMLPGPAETTDDFVQTYRLDGVRGEGAEAQVILNGTTYSVGAEIDGFTIVSAENVFYDTGDVETKAVVEGPNKEGESERIVLQAASAPNLSLTYERLRREWVYQWMLEPGLIQPGTKMPQNFVGGQSPFAGDPAYPGTSADHINLLVDTLFDAGRRRVRAPLLKIIEAPAAEFDEDGGAFEEEFNEDDFD